MRGRDWLRIDGNSAIAGVGVIASPNPTSICRRKMAVPSFAVSSTRKPPYSWVSRISVTFHTRRVEIQPIILDGLHADGSENFPNHLSLVLQKPLQIEVFCRSEIRAAPKAKKHCAFEDKSLAMG